MATWRIRADFSGWKGLVLQLRDRAPQACARALNRTATSVRVVMKRAVAQDLNLKQADIDPTIAMESARPGRLRSAVTASGRRIRLIKFGARDQRPRGVRARLPGGKHVYPHAFITRGKGGLGVFQRSGRARIPIKQLHGPTIGTVFSKHLETGMARGEEQLTKNLTHEMRWVTQQ